MYWPFNMLLFFYNIYYYLQIEIEFLVHEYWKLNKCVSDCMENVSKGYDKAI